ncbi:unnamed protein product [Arctia plantaginis]|uniref:Natalisin n=1 Tax=Arctia plantaginis TaxID=874455 RepID=A0A8S0ZX77_ARCPL|nr:unnamed protein product [Arctia plantaginis]CAB3238230.1 unnamed protein product [Arctia plantaginis]
MHKRIQTLLFFLLIVTTDVALGNLNKTKLSKGTHKKHSSLKEKLDNERIKRSLNDDDEQPFWPNRGKRQVDDDPPDNYKLKNGLEYNQRILKSSEKLVQDLPFWGNRGKRDGSENLYDYEYPEFLMKNCEHCIDIPSNTDNLKNIKDRRDDFISPFWANRGRRSSFEAEDLSEPFWGNRGRRQEKEPFLGNRGHRTSENEPFWGNRGKREDEPFWGNRGRRGEDIDPFWGNRGRRQDSQPFWGNRGRRQENEPFWGNRGRREEEPFWGNRGRRKVSEQNVLQNKKEGLKDYILSAISDVENDIENLSRLKKAGNPSSFWSNRGRDNKFSLMFNGRPRTRSLLSQPERAFQAKSSEPRTVLDNRMYVEEPNYILVERSSRSSGEDDPYYISRGKKYYLNSSFQQAARDRRGAMEEIVKSVRNDPYYIARGKKDTGVKNGRSAELKEEYKKAKDLICAAINLVTIKKDNGKVKREIGDNDRDRRIILKKLAAQLQMDPYFVSRGKKSDVPGDKDNLQEFISNIASKCD